MAGLLYIRTGNTGTDPAVAVDDLGITIATGATWTLLSATGPGDPEGNAGQFTAREIRDSDDLYNAIVNGNVEWSKDNSIIEPSGDYIADYMLFQDFTDDDLDLTAGRLTFPHATTVPPNADGREGEIFWEDDTNILYAHNGSQWQPIATASGLNNDHGSLTGLGDDDHSQYLLLGGNNARNDVTGSIDMTNADNFTLPQAIDVTATLTGQEGSLAWDIDDETLYAHDGTNWFAIAPASGIITDHGGLTGLNDDDHTQYGLLAGNAARNPITGEYDFTTGDLTVPADGTLKASPVEGNIAVKGGILYTFDATRSKWLSADRKMLEAGKKGQAKDIYLRGVDNIASSETGFRCLRDGTITGLFAQTDVASTWTMEIRRNGSVTVIASMVMTAVAGNQATTTNVDVSQGDEIQFFANTGAPGVKSPIVGIELAWRTI